MSDRTAFRAESGMVAAISWLRARQALCLGVALATVAVVLAIDLSTPGFAIAAAYLVVVVFAAVALPRPAAFAVAALALALTLAVMAAHGRLDGQSLLLVAVGVLAGVGVFTLVGLYDGVEALSREQREAYLALKEAEERFRDTLDSSADGLYRVDAATGRFDYLSPSMTAITGLSMDKLLSMDGPLSVERIHPDDRQTVLSARETLERDGVASFEFRLDVGDDYRWYHEVTKVVRGSDGRPAYRVGSLRDITDSKRRQLARDFLEAQREQLARVTTADEAMAVVGRTLGEQFHARYVFFAEREGDATSVVRVVWDDGLVDPVTAIELVSEYVSDDVVRDLDEGRTVVCADVDADDRVEGTRLRDIGLRSWMLAPFRRDGGWRFSLGVGEDAPRAWRDDEAELLAEVAARTFPRIERARAEAERRASEELFRTIVTAAGEGISVMDSEGRISFVNQALAGRLGYDVDEMVGRPPSDFVDKEDLPELQRHLRLRRQGVGDHYDLRLLDKNGHACWFLINAVPIMDGGAHTGDVALFTDITERKEWESALALQAHLLENVHDAIYALDSGYRVVFWNSAAEELFGWSRQEALGRPSKELLRAEATGESRGDALDALLQEGSFGGEVLYRHKDGHQFWADVRSQVLRGEDGRVDGVVASFRDIGEQRRAKEALAWEAARLRAIVEAAPVGLTVVAADGEVLLGNDELRRMWLGEAEVRSVEDFSRYAAFWPETGQRVQPEEWPTARALNEGESSSDVVMDIQRFDGTRGTIVVSTAPIVDNGAIMGAVTIAQDITGMREAEQALRFLTEEVRKLHETVLDDSVSSIELACNVVAQAGLLLGSDGTSIFLRADDGSLRRVAGAGVPEAPVVDDLVAQAIGEESAQIRLLPPAAWKVTRELGSVALAVPLVVRDHVFGAMAYSYQNRRSLDELQQRIAVAFADQAALAIENARLRARIEESAVEAERTRLARDLHDSVTQSLFAASLKAEALGEMVRDRDRRLKEAAGELSRLTRGALAGMRSMLLEMRPNGLTETPLPELLRHLVEASGSRFGADVTLTADGQRLLPAEVQTALYRIAQEALNNVARHAKASRAWIDLRMSEGEACLQIGDDGRGFDGSSNGPGHFGLENMRERAASIGAAFSVDSSAGRGTVVTVEWPFAKGRGRDD